MGGEGTCRNVLPALGSLLAAAVAEGVDIIVELLAAAVAEGVERGRSGVVPGRRGRHERVEGHPRHPGLVSLGLLGGGGRLLPRDVRAGGGVGRVRGRDHGSTALLVDLGGLRRGLDAGVRDVDRGGRRRLGADHHDARLNDGLCSRGEPTTGDHVLEIPDIETRPLTASRPVTTIPVSVAAATLARGGGRCRPCRLNDGGRHGGGLCSCLRLHHRHGRGGRRRSGRGDRLARQHGERIDGGSRRRLHLLGHHSRGGGGGGGGRLRLRGHDRGGRGSGRRLLGHDRLRHATHVTVGSPIRQRGSLGLRIVFETIRILTEFQWTSPFPNDTLVLPSAETPTRFSPRGLSNITKIKLLVNSKKTPKGIEKTANISRFFYSFQHQAYFDADRDLHEGIEGHNAGVTLRAKRWVDQVAEGVEEAADGGTTELSGDEADDALAAFCWRSANFLSSALAHLSAG